MSRQIDIQSILVVEDDALCRRIVKDFLVEEGLDSTEVGNGAAGLGQLEKQEFSLVLLDLELPDASGLSLVEKVLSLDHAPPVIIMTAHGDVELAVEALKLGVYDFIQKPINRERLLTSIRNGLTVGNLQSEVSQLRRLVDHEKQGGDFVAKSKSMRALLQTVKKMAATAQPVLVRGETGTGKDHIARTLHLHSERADKPFVSINCAAIPETLLESELFGHVKGAFTGASKSHTGRFVEANGGTLFLDEIGDLPLSLQAKMLRVVEDGIVRPVGGEQDVETDLRLVCATHRELEKMVESGDFREDLFFRINVLSVYLPPLRERGPEDILAIADQILREVAVDEGRTPPALVSNARDWLAVHPLRGNVRELRNLLTRALVLCEGFEIDRGLLAQVGYEGSGPAPTDTAAGASEAGETATTGEGRWGTFFTENITPIEQIEREAIRQALEFSNGNVTEAARGLGLSRATLHRKLKVFELV